MGGGERWWVYFGWLGVLVGGGGYILASGGWWVVGGGGWWHSSVLPNKILFKGFKIKA